MLYKTLKRILDICVALIAIILTGPLMIAVAVAIKLESPDGPILADIPMRVGLNGKLFKMFKFRSMIPNAHNIIKTDPKFKKFYEMQKKNQGKLKISEDPRITKVGRFIRRTDIDELPQFFNVLIGTMSIVGPRAYYEDELAQYKKEYPGIESVLQLSLTTKPGVTGPWQVSGRNNLTIPERAQIDAKYAQRKNILYDMYIILKTPIIIITRFGAFD